MIYEVRVLDSRGKIKKTISDRELSKRHWKSFDQPLSFALKKKLQQKTIKSVHNNRKAS